MKLARPNLFMDGSFPVVQQKTSADVDLPPFRLGNANSGGQKARHDKPPCRSSDHRRAAGDRNLSCVERRCQSPRTPKLSPEIRAARGMGRVRGGSPDQTRRVAETRRPDVYTTPLIRTSFILRIMYFCLSPPAPPTKHLHHAPTCARPLPGRSCRDVAEIL